MWKYVKLLLGPLLIFASINGVVTILSGDVQDMAMDIVEGGVETDGVIESRIEHTIAGRSGKIGGIGRYYTMKYNFTTLDGRKFGDEINVSKEQAYRVNDGDKIRVVYYADQPTINSALGFEEYMTETDVQELPIGTMYFSAALMFFGGLWLTWSGWRGVQPMFVAASGATRSNARSESAALKARSGPMFGNQ